MSTNNENLKQQIKEENIYCNVKNWNDNGIKGKGIVVLNGESIKKDHGALTYQRIIDAAPEATVKYGGITIVKKNNQMKSCTITVDGQTYDFKEFCINNKVDIVTHSVLGDITEGTNFSTYLQEIKDAVGTKFFNCAGNEGDKSPSGKSSITASFPNDIAYYVGACGLNKNGVPTRDNYSSVGDEIDFIDFRGWNSGTSFASPYLAGKTALIMCRYGKMSEIELFKFLKMICEDMNADGFDKYSGWGLPILPEFSKKYITMIIDDKSYKVNGIIKSMDTIPVQKNYRTFVPVRFIAEELGAEVDWNEPTRQVTITKDNTKIILTLDNTLVTVNGKKDYLDVAPYQDNNYRTMVPIRFIAESLNCEVDWIEPERKVMILEK